MKQKFWRENMFDKLSTKKDTETFEEKIIQIYNKYEKIDIDDNYIDLWNGFVELIQYIQNQDTTNNISPLEAIELLKEIGLSGDEIKQLFLEQLKEK